MLPAATHHKATVHEAIDVQHRTTRLATEILFDSCTRATFSAIGVSIAVFFIFSGVVPEVNLKLWLSIFICAYLLRLVVTRAYRRQVTLDPDPVRYLILFRALTLLCGLAWGSVGILLYNDSIVYQSFLTTLLAGVCATSASVYMVDKFTNISFLIATLLFTPPMLLAHGNHISSMIAIALVIFGIYSFAINLNNGKKFLETIKLRFEAQQSEETISALSERHRLHMEHTPLAVIEWDNNLNITFWNNAAEKMFGYSSEQALGKNATLFVAESHLGLIQEHLSSLIRGLDSPHTQIESISNNGQIIYCEWFNTVLHDAYGNINGVASLIQDQTAYIHAKKEIEDLAYLDSLTHLANRRLLMNRLEHAIAKNARKKSIGSLIYIDIDKFKSLNDTYGHRIGDLLLCEIASRLKKLLRDSDTVARLGGDEFVLMLEEIHTEHEKAYKASLSVVEKVLNSFREPFHLGHLQYQTTASIGVSLFDWTTTSPDEVLRRADAAMYQSKNTGKNTYHFYDETLQSQMDLHDELMRDLQTAVGTTQFSLRFQPQVNINTDIKGAEVLLRWKHPKRGDISPAEFIPLAEESSLIVPIGNWVLLQACLQLKEWERSAQTRHLTLSVNVSAMQFSQPNFIDHVNFALQESKCNPKKLILELTESAVVHQIEDVIQKMLTLKKLGITFSMDDFGVGYSSLSVLKRLPIDELKIDHSFVADLPDNQDSATITRAIIAMGNSLRLSIIAEGIENQAQEVFLVAAGCENFQGYFYGKPVTPEQFMTMLPPVKRKKSVSETQNT